MPSNTAPPPPTSFSTASSPASASKPGPAPREKLFENYRNGLTAKMVEDALLDRLARLELRGLQIRTLDAHIYPITLGPEIATKWTIVSGNAQLIPSKDSSVLRYRFDSPDATPIVLSCDFDFPTDAAEFSQAHPRPQARRLLAQGRRDARCQGGL